MNYICGQKSFSINKQLSNCVAIFNNILLSSINIINNYYYFIIIKNLKYIKKKKLLYFDIRIVWDSFFLFWQFLLICLQKYIGIHFNTKIKNMLIIEKVYVTYCTCELYLKYIFGKLMDLDVK